MRAVHLALLEVRSYLKDRGDLAFSLLLPIALLAVMLGAFGQDTRFNGVANIVDQDGGPLAQRLVERLRDTPGIQVRLLTPAEADSRLSRSIIILAAYIPEGFSQKLAAGQPASVVFKQRGSGGQEGQIMVSIIRGAVDDVASEAQVRLAVQGALAGSGVASNEIDATVNKFLVREERVPTIAVVNEDIGVKPDPLREFLPGIVTMFALFAVALRAQALVEERQKGTLERLRTTQLGLNLLFAGKFLSGTAKGVVQMFILLSLAAIVFRIFTAASFLGVLAVAALFAATVSALGLVIASVAKTRDQANWIGVVFTLVMSMLGGTFFEVQRGILHTLGLGTVNHYANSALKTIINGTGALGDVGFQLAVIAGVGLAALVLARVIFKAVPGGR
ncbi:MAG: ABC transporter permease [Chloroflexi bacterium]|nr:ABC transporter permease [Chloroflexota bacterium]